MGMIRFTPVAELTDPLTLAIGLSGGSGTGKTYSALLIARGIAEVMTGEPGAPIGYVDTENRRALHYKQAFPEMQHFDMQAVDESGKMIGFGPERWIEVIDAAEAAGLPVVVIDSFSHAWEGVGGVLDLHAQTLDRLTGGRDDLKDKRSQLAWAEVKPRYRRLIDRIVRAKCSMIICTRAKPVMQDFKTKQNARATKTRRQDVPWDPASDGDLMFEMTTMVILDPKAPGCPVHQIKVADQFKGLLDPRRAMGVETGRAMAEWAKGQGDAQAQKDVLDEAREKARGGKDAFTKWWQENPQHRALVKTILAECQEIATQADEEATRNEDDPFSASPAQTQEPSAQHDEPDTRPQKQGDQDSETKPRNAPDPEQFSALLDMIKRDLADAPSVDDVVDLYGPQIEQMEKAAPKLHDELQKEIAEYRKDKEGAQ